MILYRELRKADYPFIEELMNQSFGLYRYVPDAKALARFKHAYLQGCLAEQTFCKVAEKDGRVVGVIMGKADADYRLPMHISPIISVIGHTLGMKFQANRCGCSRDAVSFSFV